jgi:hypothetical protein
MSPLYLIDKEGSRTAGIGVDEFVDHISNLIEIVK